MQAALGRVGKLLTRNGAGQSTFKNSSTWLSSVEEAEYKDKGEDSSISVAEVAAVVKKLLSGKGPGVDEIHLVEFCEGHCRGMEYLFL